MASVNETLDPSKNCTVIYSRNSTQFEFDFARGWEGIPFNFILNCIFFLVS